MNFTIGFSVSAETLMSFLWELHQTVTGLARIDAFTLLSLPTHEHRYFFIYVGVL